MKRLIAFLLLVAVGVVALKFAIGDEEAVRADGDQRPTGQQKADTARRDSGQGVPIGGNQFEATVVQHGPIERLVGWEQIPLGDGRFRRREIYVLRAGDSQPADDGVQQLSDVTLKLFEEGEHAATITADQAFLEFGRDASGDLAISEDKEVLLRNAVLVSEPGSELEGLRLSLGDTRIKIGEQELRLTTPADQPIELQLDGEHSGTLTGLGVQARLPRSRDAGPRRADIVILSEPRLVTDGIDVQAAGRMRYVEDTTTGAAQITLNDRVELQLDGTSLRLAGDRTDARSSTVRGDQFTGWLHRRRSGDKSRDADAENERRKQRPPAVFWQRLVLAGAPAVVELPGVRVETPRIMVRAGALGEPALVTAFGGPSRVEQTEIRPGSDQEHPIVGTAPRRMHLLRLGESVGSLHRRYGFPQWSLRPLYDQRVIVFEGEAELTSGEREVRSSNGLIVTQRESTGSRVVQARGQVELRDRGLRDRDDALLPELVVRGNDGLLLHTGEEREVLQIGPAADDRSRRWQEHVYSVLHGGSRIDGVGTCRIDHRGELTTLTLRAPHDQIRADFPVENLELRNVRQLLATVRGERVTELDVGGLPVRAQVLGGDQNLLVRAPRVRQIGPRSLRLLPMPIDESPWNELPEIDRMPHIQRTWREGAAGDGSGGDYTVEVFGPRIDVHHLGGQDVLIDAHADEDDATRIYARMPQPGADEPTTVSCTAGRLRILPYVLSPFTRRAYGGGVALGTTGFHSLGRSWLVVDDVREFELDDEQQGHIEGSARQLFISQGAGAALFVGDPDTQVPAIVTRTLDGRIVTMRGARVRMQDDDVVRLSALGTFVDRSVFLSPTMTLHEPGASGLLSHMQAVCRGNIDVEPDRVLFGGPVEAEGLLPDGRVDPAGMHIDARELVMLRRDGRVHNVRGRDVVVDWTQLDARAAEVELDLVTSQCTATDPDGAEVVLPGGRVVRSAYVEANYRTWVISLGPGSATDARAKASEREAPATRAERPEQDGRR